MEKMSGWKWDSVMGRQVKSGGTEAGEEEEGVCGTVHWHLSSTGSHIPDSST